MPHRAHVICLTGLLGSCGALAAGLFVHHSKSAQAGQVPAAHATEPPIVVPRLWSAKELEGWATPLAGLGVPPTMMSEEQFYAIPIDNLRSYPVYHPDHEPPGYREGLIKRGPQPLIEPEKLKTMGDWIEAGRIVFESLETPSARSDDPSVIAHFTNAKAIDKYRDADHDSMTADGILIDYRWVVDRDSRLLLSVSSCYGCHSRLMSDGHLLVGAPCNFDVSEAPAVSLMLDQIIPTLPSMPGGEKFYAQFGVPWRADDPHQRFKTMPDQERAAFLSQETGEPPGTMFARFNGSPLYKTRMADLRGVRDRRYLDATGTHANRGPADIARYGLLVEYALDSGFGPHQMLPADALKGLVRPPDEAMYALGLYVYSLDPVPSPHPFDDRARIGQQIFVDEGCAKCHTPPAYTNNKLIPVPGFEPRLDDPATARLNISNRRVNTDPGLALLTRKGTGYYKVPSLRGVWYRGLYGHCGYVTSLEEWFDPKRLRSDYVPSGFRGPGVKSMAVPGHDFGLDLTEDERRALIAFLRTL